CPRDWSSDVCSSDLDSRVQVRVEHVDDEVGDLQPRLSGGAGGGLPARLHLRPRQPRRRRPLHVPGPENPTLVSTRATALPLPEEFRPVRGEWWVFLRRLARRRTSLFGLVVVAVVVVTALGATWVTPFDPVEQDIGDRLKPRGS